MPESLPRRRVFLFGLDGATFTLLRPWAEAGKLPTLARLMAGGTWGPLLSTIPASTPVAWNSMVTGVYPGKHGVFGFVQRRPGSYELDVITSRDRRRPALWNLVDQVGLRSVVVDVPFTYPPEPINGVMIAGLGTPDVTTAFVHPARMRDVILREFGSYPLDIYFQGDVLAFLEDARRLTDHRLAVTQFLMRECAWDFFMLGLMTTDRLQHALWKYVDPRHSAYAADDARRFGPAILDYYRRLDDLVADLVGRLDGRTVFMMASDHGFGPLERGVSLLRWLVQAGFVVAGGRRWEYAPPERVSPFKRRGPGRVSQNIRGGPGRPAGLTLEVKSPNAYAGAVFRITGLDPDRRYELKAAVTDATPEALLEFDDLTRRGHPIIGGGPIHGRTGEIWTVFQPQAAVVDLMVCQTTYGGNPCGHITVGAVTLTEREDWSHTMAYVVDTGDATEGRRLRLNVRGREPQGIVAMGEEYERVRERIAAGILALRDDEGHPLVARVFRQEELYRGPYADEGPDLAVVFADGVGGTGPTAQLSGYAPDSPVSVRMTKGNSGNHRPDGIFVAYGPGVAAGQTLAADIVDVCPTILDLLGVPISEDTDGRVLREMHRSGTAGAAPAVIRGGPGDASRTDTGVAVYSEQERQQIEDRLRRLGYLE